jgi:hypothetical protein
MKIGITLSLRSDFESMWINGIKLNVLNLLKTLQQIEGYEVYALDTGDVVTDLTKVTWDYNKYPILKFNNSAHEMDLIIMLGTSLPTSLIQKLKNNKPSLKVVKYQCGNNYVIDMERVLFDTKDAGLPSWDQGHDETWMIPQQEYQNKDYYQLIYRQNSEQLKVVPFVWDPEHMMRTTVMLHKSGKKIPGYKRANRKDKKLSVMEPNMNVVKYSLIPLMAAEKVYREFGEGAFKQMYIGSGQGLLKNEYYKGMLKHFDMVNHNPPLVKYIARYPVVLFLAEETDIVVSHQWENPLNYAYLDALYFNYPLVHNAEFIKDAGYYYEGFSINEAAAQLEYALSHHDNNIETYKEKNKKVLNRYLSTNKDVVDTYKKLIENVFEPGKHDLSYDYDHQTNLYK